MESIEFYATALVKYRGTLAITYSWCTFGELIREAKSKVNKTKMIDLGSLIELQTI